MQPSSHLLSPEKIKYLRKDNGWSQELLAKASGLSLRTIQRAEKDGNCSVETQLALAAAFNIFPKELTQDSNQPEVVWKRKNIMFGLIAIITVGAAIFMLAILAGGMSFYNDAASGIYIVLFMYATTAVSFGGQGLVKSITGLRYIVATDISHTPASAYLARILNKQIYFVYGGAVIGFLIGSIAIHSNIDLSDPKGADILHPAYAVCLVVVLYAALIAECILRPLATKLEKPKE